MEEKSIIALDGWKLKEKEYLSEDGFSAQQIELCYITIDGGKICQRYDVLTQSEHYILTSTFAIRRPSWAEAGKDSDGYMDIYAILEKLEECESE